MGCDTTMSVKCVQGKSLFITGARVARANLGRLWGSVKSTKFKNETL